MADTRIVARQQQQKQSQRTISSSCSELANDWLEQMSLRSVRSGPETAETRAWSTRSSRVGSR